MLFLRSYKSKLYLIAIFWLFLCWPPEIGCTDDTKDITTNLTNNTKNLEPKQKSVKKDLQGQKPDLLQLPIFSEQTVEKQQLNDHNFVVISERTLEEHEKEQQKAAYKIVQPAPVVELQSEIAAKVTEKEQKQQQQQQQQQQHTAAEPPKSKIVTPTKLQSTENATITDAQKVIAPINNSNAISKHKSNMHNKDIETYQYSMIFFSALGFAAIMLILYKFNSMRFTRAERKYGVQGDHTTQELTPLPLAVEDGNSDDEDHTLFQLPYLQQTSSHA